MFYVVCHKLQNNMCKEQRVAIKFYFKANISATKTLLIMQKVNNALLIMLKKISHQDNVHVIIFLTNRELCIRNLWKKNV